MRRRVKDVAEGDRPTRLQRYDPADWPNPDCHPECAFWEAQEMWREANPIDREDPRPVAIIDGPDVPWHPEWI